MFPRGPRFEPTKISDVPGPNSYNIASADSQEDYKRGAFLEKANRFSREKESDVPGPGTYDVEPKKKVMKNASAPKPSGQPQNLVDRYAVLQRKVEDLERVHNDGKKAHQSEIDRLKLELTRYQKSNAEQADRLEKQKKQNDALDARLQDLKKAASSDQADLKDLRVKLRMSEHERTQMASKQSEASELKKSLQSLEAKRRDELRERDRRIAELEKTSAGEKKKRELVESRLQEIKGKGDDELQAARTAKQKLEALVRTTQAEAQNAQSALASLEEEACDKEETLLAQLEHHRSLVRQVAEEYSRLAASTVPSTLHTLLKHQHATSQMQTIRLERKLANAEGQVVELANLIRQTKEQNIFLSQSLNEANDENDYYSRALLDATSVPHPEPEIALTDALDSINGEIVRSRHDIYAIESRSHELSSQFYRLACGNLIFEYSVAEKQLREAQDAAQQHASSLASALASHEAIAARLERLQQERAVLEEQLKTATGQVDAFRSSSESLTRQIAELEDKMAEAAAHSDAALKKERDVVHRLSTTVQNCRTAEEALRAEIEQLTTELTDAERYQEAYYSLSDEVGSLVARNQLAEDEAQRLSKFNAEILGHNNPAQRIMYVDRIRREMAETKHKLVLLTREQEAVVAVNGDLQHELDMYKSVMVPPDQKPRTTITRIGRPPLVNLTRSLNTSTATSVSKLEGSAEKVATSKVHVLESIPGDMTLDEII
ncbi:hypothetical protein Hypma_002648 [Hypsizygus marmoreus]|uniref:Hyaluronan-mediated motility receptor C-terminal domain-containing protein n=1 Tax=Hypsizygus marmoreus TaxID=39966 RepID=A0A369J877_HYPMA|nr:hypothetical protein Hypma_002648 [Hypsizygus marmoreus]